MAMTGSIGFSQGATSPWVQLQQGAVNMAQVLHVEFEGKGDQLRATLVFSLRHGSRNARSSLTV